MPYEVSCDEEECVFEDGGLCINSRLTMSGGKCTSKVDAGSVKRLFLRRLRANLIGTGEIGGEKANE